MNRRDFLKFSIMLAGCGMCGCSVLPDGKMSKIVKSRTVLPCRSPFEDIEVQPEGDVIPCCYAWIKKKPMGNLFKEDFHQIWNGETFNKLREKLLDEDYSWCNRKICEYEASQYNEDFDANKQGPKNIRLCYDQECNYKCITCRDKVQVNSKEKLAFYNSQIKTKILPMLKNAEQISFSGGDPLVSRHTRKIIKTVCKKYKNIKIALETNGYLLDKANLEELGAIDNLSYVSISIHAATRETYAKITRSDSFDRIMKNLEFVANLKKEGKLHHILINFVVQSMNYKEMPAFVKIAEKLDIEAAFWSYLPWPTAKLHERYKEIAVFEPYHKDFPKFKKMLKSEIFKSEHCHLSPDFIKIAQS